MVYGVLKLINFAHGEVYMVGAMTGYYTAHALGFADAPSLSGLAATLAISMAACALLGAVIERVAYRPVRGAPDVTLLPIGGLLSALVASVIGARHTVSLCGALAAVCVVATWWRSRDLRSLR